MTALEKGVVDIAGLRRDFPVLDQRVHDRPLVYLDNAATTQKPRAVIDAIDNYYAHDNSNVHRGVHTLSERATAKMEAVRGIVQSFINAREEAEIIFTPGTTASINIVANGFARAFLKPGDEVLITGMEHHANIVPWQQACEFSGATLQVANITDSGELDLDDFKRKLSSRTKIAAFTHVSNALGTINPIVDLIAFAKAVGAAVLIDGAQAVAHAPVDVQQLDCDFYVFSGHKLYGPTGTGVLYGKREWLDKLPVYQTGGDMIRIVTFEKTTFAPIPHKFEAGTPHIAGIIGLGAAINYLTSLPWAALVEHENRLLDYATERALQIPGLKIIGTAAKKAAVLSFTLDNIHPHDIGTFLDFEGVAVRAGHHCAMPVMQRFDVPATARASFAIYNTMEEVDALIAAIESVCKTFA
ncbi:MAG: cysteine desulfurase [Spongiibacteraceae bacterium]